LEHQNLGFATQGRYLARVNPFLNNYPPQQLQPLFRQIRDNLLAIPGVRMALGASRGRVTRMVLRGACGQGGVGVLVGVPAAIAAARLMSNQLFNIQPGDPMILVLAILLLGLAALLASVIPATRAATVEPMVALRNQ